MFPVCVRLDNNKETKGHDLELKCQLTMTLAKATMGDLSNLHRNDTQLDADVAE